MRNLDAILLDQWQSDPEFVSRRSKFRARRAMLRQAFATTPTSMVNRLMGLETWTDAVNFGTPAHIFGGAVSFTGNPTFSGSATHNGVPPIGSVGPVVVPAATTTLTLTPAAHANRIVCLQSTGGLIITPPAATGTGNLYSLAVITTISGGSVTIDFKAANASDVINGTAIQFKSGTGATFYSAGTNTNLITLNGTTTGGIIGDYIEIQDVATHQWIICGFVTQATSTVATPFSNH